MTVGRGARTATDVAMQRPDDRADMAVIVCFAGCIRRFASPSDGRRPVVERCPGRRRFAVTGPVLVVALAVALGVVGWERGIDSAQDAAATGFRADVTTVAEDGRARVDVVLTGARDEADYEVVAVVEQRRTVLTEVGDGAATERRFTGLVEVSTGDFVPIDVFVHGPDRATLTTGVVLDEPGASIDRIVDDEMIDTMGDGEPDTWRIGVAVVVVEPGTYRLNVDLANADGARVLSTTGIGALQSGPGLIDVEVPVEVLERLAVAGPLEVVNATLSHGDGAPIRAASTSSVGTVPAPQW
jgi:hypothetical protein